jgi:hypothetical protein
MKIKLSELRQVIRGSILKEIKTRDGKQWKVVGNFERAMAEFGSTMAEREAISKGQIPASPELVAFLKGKGIIKQVEKEQSPARPGPDPAEKLHKKRQSVRKAYDTAVRKFAKDAAADYESSEDVSAEDASWDIADAFFWEYPEWKLWSNELGYSRDEIREAVAEWFFSEFQKKGGK